MALALTYKSRELIVNYLTEHLETYLRPLVVHDPNATDSGLPETGLAEFVAVEREHDGDLVGPGQVDELLDEVVQPALDLDRLDVGGEDEHGDLVDREELLDLPEADDVPLPDLGLDRVLVVEVVLEPDEVGHHRLDPVVDVAIDDVEAIPGIIDPPLDFVIWPLGEAELTL